MSSHIFREDAFAGVSILLTGGGPWVEISKGLTAKRAKVHICGRRPASLEAAFETISKCGPVAASHHLCDERGANQVDAIWRDAPPTSLLNNAATNFISPTKDLSPRGFRAVTSTVMDGSFHATLAAGRRWIARSLRG